MENSHSLVLFPINSVSPELRPWLVLQDGIHGCAPELVCPAHSGQLDEDACAGHLRAEASDQIKARLHGSARGQEVIHHQDSLVLLDCIDVNLKRVGAILQPIVHGMNFGRELARLADRNKPA